MVIDATAIIRYTLLLSIERRSPIDDVRLSLVDDKKNINVKLICNFAIEMANKKNGPYVSVATRKLFFSILYILNDNIHSSLVDTQVWCLSTWNYF